MTAQLYVDAAIYAAEDPFATALLVEDGQIAWMGTDTAARTLMGHGVEVVDVAGALIAPAFVDSHVHLNELGRSLEGLDLSTVRSAAELLDAVAGAARALPAGVTVIGSGWEESGWADRRLPSPEELSRAAGGRRVYLARADVHTALACPALRAAAGVPVRGALDESHHHAVRLLALSEDSVQGRDRRRRLALGHLTEHGHAALAEMAAPHVSGEQDLRELLALTASEEAAGLARVYPYWGQRVGSSAEAAEVLASFGGRIVGLAGDLSCDGSLGARTAALREPYADAPSTRGELLLEATDVAGHVAACAEAGIQAGFHAIGDAGVDVALEGFALAAGRVGARAVRAGAHRLEHVEAIGDAGIATMLELGLTASVQPRFDEYWGGQDGLYAERLGQARAAALNPLASLHAAGVPLALGSDAPVTGARPWAAVRACLEHHTPTQRLTARAAFLAHTRAGYRAAGERHPLAGTLRWGSPATFAVWEAGELTVELPAGAQTTFSADARARTPMLPVLEGGDEPSCLLTVRDGVTLWDATGMGATSR